jgi:transposase
LFKEEAVGACQQAGVSVAAVALARGVNANLLRRWVAQAERTYLDRYTDGLKYTAFCVKFQTWRHSRAVTLALTHVPGDQLFVDYAGDPVSFTDRTTGLDQRAWLFVAVWPYSAKMYVEATRTQTSPDWLSAHVRALEAFGCAPRM